MKDGLVIKKVFYRGFNFSKYLYIKYCLIGVMVFERELLRVDILNFLNVI